MRPAEHTVEARGVLCPVPIIRLARAARALPPGTVLELLTDDPAAEHDVPAWCRLRGHELLSTIALEAGQIPGVAGAPGGSQGSGGSVGPQPGAARHPAGPAGMASEPRAPNPAPGQALRHLIRLAAPAGASSAPG